MPGRWDTNKTSTINTLGNAFPGSKQGKAWENGFVYRYGGTAIERPASNNPWDQTTHPVERGEWANGWDVANANTAGNQYGPATTGAPPV